MDQKELTNLFLFNPAVQMLRLRNAPWVLPFLHRIFKTENRFLIPEDQLIQLLSENLDLQEDGLEDLEEARILFGEDEQTRSR